MFFWYLVHCFAIPSYRSSSSLVLIDPYFTELWPLDLENFINYQFYALFFSLLADIHLIFGTLLSHIKLQIKFASLVLIHSLFTELWPLDLENFIIYQFSALYLSLFADVLLIFSTLLCHTNLQIKLEFGFDLFIFH